MHLSRALNPGIRKSLFLQDNHSPVPIIASSDPIEREIDFVPSKAPYDPRWMLAGRPHPSKYWFLDVVGNVWGSRFPSENELVSKDPFAPCPLWSAMKFLEFCIKVVHEIKKGFKGSWLNVLCIFF